MSQETTDQENLAYIDAKLDAILDRPALWGGLEPLILTLLMMRRRIHTLHHGVSGPRAVAEF